MQGFGGELIEPGHLAYDASRQVWNAMVDRKPALIARCASRDDVVAALRYGRQAGLEIGVRCGGHSVLGVAVPDGGLMLDLAPMGAVRVDPERRRAWVQGGALLGALDVAAQRHGLATTAGNVSHTGVGGLTLGGGMGWLARRYGLTCDNVVSFEVVTADGEVVRASETEHTELYWGLRGGGGNFGVVTEFEFQLHPVGTEALLVNLIFRAEQGAEVLRGWRDLLPEASRQATLTSWVGLAGEWSFLPPEFWGQPVVAAGYVWVGDPAAGRRLLPAFRGLGTPIAEYVAEPSYLELQTMDDNTEGHRFRRYWKGHYLREFSDDAIDAYLSVVTEPQNGVQPGASLQAYGGAIAEIDDDATAFSQRDALVEFVASSRWTDPAEDAARIAASRRYGAAIEPFASGNYVNTMSDEGQAGVRRAYRPEKLARLTALKDQYDPDNVFRLNANIRPSRAADPVG